MPKWSDVVKERGKKMKPRKPRPPVQLTFATTRLPRDGDPGAVIPVHFIVEDNALILTDENGVPIDKGKSYTLQRGDNEKGVASRLALLSWKGTNPDFNRQLHYQPLGLA